MIGYGTINISYTNEFMFNVLGTIQSILFVLEVLFVNLLGFLLVGPPNIVVGSIYGWM